MKTHTPGPWLATPTTCGNPRKPYTVRMDVVTTSGEWNPAFVAGDILPEDARLIASAPDLLSALNRLIQCLSEDPEDYPDSSSARQVFDSIEFAREAISKATGGAA
jgi:hypothetical protein